MRDEIRDLKSEVAIEGSSDKGLFIVVSDAVSHNRLAVTKDELARIGRLIAIRAGYSAALGSWRAINGAEDLPKEVGHYDVTFAPQYADPFVASEKLFDGERFEHGFDFEPVAWRQRPKPYIRPGTVQCSKCRTIDGSGLTPRTGSYECDPHDWQPYAPPTQVDEQLITPTGEGDGEKI